MGFYISFMFIMILIPTGLISMSAMRNSVIMNAQRHVNNKVLGLFCYVSV